MKQMQMRCNQLLTDNSVISVDNTYTNGSFPYWISNPTGATLKRIKLMAGRVIAGKFGGTVTVEVYQTRDVAIRNTKNEDGSSKFPNSGLPADYIRANWTKIDELDFTLRDADEFYSSSYAITNINIPNDCYIIGLVKINGDLQVINLFVYVDYEDNPME